MVSGNPFAADSEVWRAASTSKPAPPSGPQDPFAAEPQLFATTGSQQDPFAPQLPPPAALRANGAAAPLAQAHSFSELGLPEYARPQSRQGNISSAGITLPQAPANQVQPLRGGPSPAGSQGFQNFSSQSSTPTGSLQNHEHPPQQQQAGFPGFNSQASTPRYIAAPAAAGSRSFSGSPAPQAASQPFGAAAFSSSASNQPAASFPTQFSALAGQNPVHQAYPLPGSQLGSQNAAAFPVDFGEPAQQQSSVPQPGFSAQQAAFPPQQPAFAPQQLGFPGQQLVQQQQQPPLPGFSPQQPAFAQPQQQPAFAQQLQAAPAFPIHFAAAQLTQQQPYPPQAQQSLGAPSFQNSFGAAAGQQQSWQQQTPPGLRSAPLPSSYGLGNQQGAVPGYFSARDQGAVQDPFASLSSGQNSGFAAASASQPLSANALQQPFYPPGDGYRLSKPAAEEDDKLWDFASLSTLKPQLLKGKTAPEPPKDKAGLKPMRPTDDGSWVQPWSVSGSSRASSGQPSQPVPGWESSFLPTDTVSQSQPPAQSGPGPASASAGPLQAPVSPVPAVETVAPNPSPPAVQQPAATAPPPAPAVAAPAPAPQQVASRVPWALAPPKSDLPRPTTTFQPTAPQLATAAQQQENGGPAAASEWASFSVSPKSMDADTATRLQQLDLSKLPASEGHHHHSVLSDEQLARQLQEQWNLDNGVASTHQGSKAHPRYSDSLGGRRPSGVAGLVQPPQAPPQSALSRPPATAPTGPATAGTNLLGGSFDNGAAAGGVKEWQSFSRGSEQPQQTVAMPTGWNAGPSSEAASRARAFLAASGGSQEDAELAKKLQEAYDAELAKGLEGGPAVADSTASRAGWWEGQANQGGQAPAPQPDTAAEDEALAHRLQQEEIARQQQAGGWAPQQQPGFGYPQQQPGFGYPQQQPGYGYPQQQPAFGYPQQQPGYGYPQQGTGYPPTQGYTLPGSQQPQWTGAAQYGQPQPVYPAQSQGQQAWQQSGGGSGGGQSAAVDDEAMARQLQEQFDREAGQGGTAAAAQPQLQPGNAPAVKPSAPTWRRRFDRLLSQPADNTCMGCQQPIVTIFGGQWRSAMGGKWHPGCLLCGQCRQPISDSRMTEQEGQLYHMHCFKEAFHPRCCVCQDFCPESNNQIRWTTDTFWKYKACPKHTSDGTVRCYACNRFQPQDQQWVQVSTEGSRHLCLDCVSSIVVDTADAQPLYAEVLQFYESMRMRVPNKPPLLLVESSALESAEAREGRCNAGHRHDAAPVFHTRGLTLSMEYHNMRTMVRNHRNSFFDLRPEVVHIPGRVHCEVTAILVLAGLPRLMAGSILAHEVMHAWLRLTGSPKLGLDVEEGLCQLMALLWLESQPTPPKGSWEERLMSYCAHQIRTEASPVYGDGFRAALENFQKFGLPEVVRHVKQNGCFAI